MKQISTEQVLKRIVAITSAEDKAPPFDGEPANVYFWEQVKQLHEKGYLTNIYITKGNMGEPIGITLFRQNVLTMEGAEYLATSHQKKWWYKILIWLVSAAGLVGIYLFEKVCDNLF